MSRQPPASPGPGAPDIPGIPLEDVAHLPLPGMVHPAAFAFSPDDRHLTCLHSPERSLRRELWAHDVESGAVVVVAGAEGGATEEDLSLEEKLRRERQRELGIGVTRYRWADEADRLLVPGPDGVEVVDGVAPGAARRTLLRGLDRPVLDPCLSPDGGLVGFVLDAEVHVVDASGAGSGARAVTSGARGTGRTNGLAEFVAQEELDRARGWWWSPDGSRIAFTEVDETAIPVYRIVHQGADAVGEGAQEDHRYPFAGGANATVRLGIAPVPAEGDGPAVPVWAALPGLADGYLARVDWFDDGTLAVQVLDRPQTRLEVLRVHPVTGAATTLVVEESDVWVNVHDCFRALPDGGFLWASERTGFRHLEVRDAVGGLVRTLTAGRWMVDGVAGISPPGAADPTVWFTGTADGPTERHLYAVPLAGGPVRRLTTGAGTHAVAVDHAGKRFVDTHHGVDRPPTVTLRALPDGALVRTVFDEADPRVTALGLVPPELTTVTTRDGETLHACLYVPSGEGPFPTVVAVYGGPHAQLVADAWARTVSLRAQHLRALGYLVVSVDNRGSWGRGLAFEGAVKHDLGSLEVRDQVDALRALAGRGLVDPDRVGIYGWSYGGYLAAMCLAREPDVFKVAVAGAPVTSWDGYDTCYTERYMGTPAENPAGYERSSVLTHAAGIRGRLMLVHGLIDENVHFRHTARLLNALVRARVPSELVLFPDERHVPRAEADRVFMEERVVGFLRDHL